MLEVLGDGTWADVEGAGDGQVGAAARGELEDLDLAVGQVGETVGPRGRQGGPRAVPIVRPPERIAQRLLDRAEHRAVLLGEVASGPAHRERGHPACGHGGHAEGNLVINGYMSEILRVNAQPVEPLPADNVADLGWPVPTRAAVMNKQGMLVQVGLEYRDGSRVKAARRKFGVITKMSWIAADLLVCHDITAHQAGQPWQDKPG